MRQMKMGLFLAPGGHHMAAWRHPDAYPAGFSIDSYIAVAQLAERGCFDMMFVADVYSTTREGGRQDSFRFEPLTLLSALAMATKRIGLVATATTSFNEPYNVARKFSSLDHLSKGRAGWNIVTSSSTLEAYNFGREAHRQLSDRYRKAHEFVEVVRGLWESWEDDALLIDKQSGLFFDSGKLHQLNHDGAEFSVRGPLTLPRAPQGHPVLVQAGSSEDGKGLAAKYAEVIFTIQRELPAAQAFYADIKQRVASFGRDPAHALVMPGVMPVVGRTRQEAEDKYAQLQALIHPEAGLSGLSRTLGIDLTGVDVDGPLPPIDTAQLSQSRAVGMVETALRDHLSVRQVYERLLVSKGHRQLIGSAMEVADSLHEWFEASGADGFNVMPAMMPNGLRDFVELVIPELQRRGVFRKAYGGVTLREHLGLPRPDADPR